MADPKTLVQWLRVEANLRETARGIGSDVHHEYAKKFREAADTIERLERELAELKRETHCARCNGSGQVNGGLGHQVSCSMCFGTGKART